MLEGDNGDVVSVLLRFENGVTAYLNAILYTPLYLRFCVFGTHAWAEYRNETHPDTPGPSTLTVQVTGQLPRVTNYDWTDSVRANLDLFAQAATGRATYPFTDMQKIGNIAILQAIVTSVAEGRPVCIAMQKLEHEGLIEIEPRRGHRVKPVSVADAEDILDLRIILESGVVRRITEKADDAELAGLDRFRTADLTSIPAFTAYNREFHHSLSVLSGNRRLAEETRRVMEIYDRLCVVSLNTLRGEDGFAGPLADHNAIIDALQTRNAAAAARVVARHVGKSRGSIMRGLGRRPIVD